MWLASAVILLIVIIQQSLGQTNESNAEITLFSISNLLHNAGKSAVGGQWLAIEEINNNSNLLPDYKLNLKIFDGQSDRQVALKHALNISSHKNSMNNTYFPIILGTPWSLVSTTIAPVLHAFNMAQMSAASTSIILSDTLKYPYFYRTIPSDKLQSKGIILLCNEFNWTSIVVVYVNNAYGLYLWLEIETLAEKYNIEVTSVAISETEDITYKYAAKQIQDLNIFIIVLIIHPSNALPLFNTFKTQRILKYPYFYLGTDGWFDILDIKEYNLTQTIQGSIGTLPWQPHSISMNEYDDDIRSVINKSVNYRSNVVKQWKYYYNNEYPEKLLLETPGNYMIYAYDAVYTLVYAMQHIEDNEELYGGDLLDLIYDEDSNKILRILNDIIVNKTDFIGMSGQVTFDENGDRMNGLYSFGNVLNDGSMNYFGYCYENNDGQLISKLNMTKIIWPQYFIDKGIMPHSQTLIHHQLTSIPSSGLIIIFIMSLLSVVIVLLCMLFIIHHRQNKIIKAGSYRLNIIMCFGAILVFIRAMMYGMDESLLINNPNKQYILNMSCNIRTWIATISYTLLFMPLFAKTYRLSQIFNTILIKKIISDKQLFILIAINVLIDIILLIILISLHPLKRLYLTGNVEIVDEIQSIQYMYAWCSEHHWYLYAIIIFWKLCQSLWGIHVSLTVDRINHDGKGIISKLRQFDETQTQLFSILFTFIVICIAAPIFVFAIWIKHILLSYLSVVIPILLIGNVVVSINLFPRIFAVISGNDERFKKSPSEQIEAKIKTELYRLGTEQNWWKKNGKDDAHSMSDQFLSVDASKRIRNKCSPLPVYNESDQHTSDDQGNM